MVNVKKGDFIELEYTGSFKDGRIFDTSIKKIGEKEHLHKKFYEPLKMVVGEKQVILGLDKKLENIDVGKEYTFNIPMEEAYGKKDSKLIRVVSKTVFTKQKMNPYPGLQINAEGSIGIIRSVSGGRVTVDFNHSMSGKDLIFKIKVNKIIVDVIEKVQSLITNLLMIDKMKYNTEFKDGKLNISADFKIPEVMLNLVREKIKKLVPEIKSIEFSVNKNEATTSE